MVVRIRFMVGGAFLVLLMCAACGSAPNEATPKTAAGPVVEPTAPRTVQVVRPEPIADADGFSTALYVENDVKIAARATGPIAKLLVDRGARVTSGQTLALIETSVPEQELHLAEHELELAQEERARLKPLEAQKVVSSQESRRAEIAENLAATKVELARARLERYSVRAPFQGQVVERWASVGQHIVEDDGTPLFRIVADQRPRARIDIPEHDQSAWPVNAPVIIETAYSGEEVRGRVVYKSPVVDPASATIQVIVEVTETKKGLSPGAAARVRLADSAPAAIPVWRLPEDAVFGDSNDAWLFVVHDGVVKRQSVEILARSSDGTRVRGALGATDMVVVGAGLALPDGTAVRAVQRAP